MSGGEKLGACIEWRCFHCGDLFTDRLSAARHFGADEGKMPACQIKGAEGGLLRALRDAEAEADDAIQRMHEESTDAAKAYHSQRCRHAQALIAAEEVGYERGLSEGRADPLLVQALEALRETEAAMRRGVDGTVLDTGWNITALNRARPAIRAILAQAKERGL